MNITLWQAYISLLIIMSVFYLSIKLGQIKTETMIEEMKRKQEQEADHESKR